MRAKLGLADRTRRRPRAGRRPAAAAWPRTSADFTITFRRLASFDAPPARRHARARPVHRPRGLRRLGRALRRAPARENSVDAERAVRMNRVNPKFVLRNHLAEVAIRAARRQGDFGEDAAPAEGARAPVRRTTRSTRPYADFPPEWAQADRGLLFIMSHDYDDPHTGQKTDAEWRAQLDPMQYQVARQAATERAFTGKYWDHWDDGSTTASAAARRCSSPTPSSTPAAAGRATGSRSTAR